MTLREISLWYWLVDKLPVKLVYFCFMKVWNEGCSEEYGEVNEDDASKIRAQKVITRFSTKHNIEF